MKFSKNILVEQEITISDLEHNKASVRGWFCKASQKFIGLVSISIFDTENCLIKSMKGTLNPQNPLRELCLMGGATIIDYDSITYQIDRKRIGMLNDNNDFDISLDYEYVNGELDSVRFVFPKTFVYRELQEAVTTFKEIYAKEIADAFASPCFSKTQALSSLKTCSFSIQWLIDTMQQYNKEVVWVDKIDELERLDSPTAGCKGKLYEQCTAVRSTIPRQVGSLYRTYKMKYDDRFTISEGSELTTFVSPCLIQTQEYRKQTNTKTQETWELSIDRINYEKSNLNFYQRRMIYSDGTNDNTQGFCLYETNNVDDTLLMSVFPEKGSFLLDKTTIKIVYYNEPVCARLVSLTSGAQSVYELKMGMDFNPSQLRFSLEDIVSSPAIIIDFSQYDEKSFEHTHSRMVQRPGQKHYQAQHSTFFRHNNTLLNREERGLSNSGADFEVQSHRTFAFPGVNNRTPSVLESAEEPFSSQAKYFAGHDRLELVDCDSSSNALEVFRQSQQRKPVYEEQVDSKQMSFNDSNEDISNQNMASYFDLPFSQQVAEAEVEDISFNCDWNNNLFWVEEEAWDCVRRTVNDPLVKKLSSQWTYPKQITKPVSETLSLEFTPAIFKENPSLLDDYRNRFIYEEMLCQLAKVLPMKAVDELYLRFAVLKSKGNYAWVTDLSWAKGAARQAYQQPMHLIKMLREFINPNDEKPSFKCTFGSMMLLFRLISWVDVTLKLNRISKTESGLPSSSLDVMNFLKSDDFMAFLCSIIESNQEVDLSLAKYCIKQSAVQSIEAQLAKVICHLISIDDQPIHYFNYLSMLNGIGLVCTRTSMLPSQNNCDVDDFSDLLKSSCLYHTLKARIDHLNPQELSTEQMLMFVLILGHIAHDAISGKEFVNKYSHDNQFSSLIQFRHYLLHGKSFSCAGLLSNDGLLDRAESLMEEMQAQARPSYSA